MARKPNCATIPLSPPYRTEDAYDRFPSVPPFPRLVMLLLIDEEVFAAIGMDDDRGAVASKSAATGDDAAARSPLEALSIKSGNNGITGGGIIDVLNVAMINNRACDGVLYYHL